MLGNREKMVVISPKTNEWPQSQVDDQKVSMASSGRVMEKPGQELLQQQQEAFKCPRCDSSNTKFCYYNNYSLSQPRHFCKACKRYWTRGGTLRNVPVGGGCRKNKRVKRPATSAMDTAPSSSSALTANSNPSSQAQIDIASTSSHINPLFYGLPSNSCDMSLPFPKFNSRVSSVDTVSGYDLQPQMNALGLDFPSGILSSEASVNNYRNGFYLNNTLLSSYNSIFGSSSTSPPTSPIMTFLLNSTLQQQKFVTGGEAEMVALKEAKSDEGQNRLGWNGIWHNPELVGLSDPPLYWNAGNAMCAWSDQTNIGPSVTSLI